MKENQANAIQTAVGVETCYRCAHRPGAHSSPLRVLVLLPLYVVWDLLCMRGDGGACTRWYYNTASSYCVLPYLVFDHGAEVVVPEEHAQLPLLHGRRQLTQPVVRELGRRAAQELLRHHAWSVPGERQWGTLMGNVNGER